MVVNTDALTSQNRFHFHFVYSSLPNCGGARAGKMKGSEERMGIDIEIGTGGNRKENWKETSKRIADERDNKRAKMRGTKRR